MDIVSLGKERFHWAGIISNNIDVQFIKLERTKTFYIGSYIIYSLAWAYEYIGLMYRGPVGTRSGQLRACESYPQLHYLNKPHYRRVNDAFTMHITRTLQGGIHKRLSREAKELIKFTYIRVQGCSCPPLMLPQYPTNKLILLEIMRLLMTYNKVQKKKTKTKISFPISLGNSLEVSPSLQAAEKIGEELKSFLLQPYTPRDNFDPYGIVRKTSKRKHKHKLHLEDHFMNALDDLGVRKKMCSMLSTDIIKATKVFNVPN